MSLQGHLCGDTSLPAYSSAGTRLSGDMSLCGHASAGTHLSGDTSLLRHGRESHRRHRVFEPRSITVVSLFSEPLEVNWIWREKLEEPCPTSQHPLGSVVCFCVGIMCCFGPVPDCSFLMMSEPFVVIFSSQSFYFFGNFLLMF